MSGAENQILTLLNPELGMGSVLLGLLLILGYISRKDNREHREDFKKINSSLLEVVRENTEAKVELNMTIKELREDLRNRT